MPINKDEKPNPHLNDFAEILIQTGLIEIVDRWSEAVGENDGIRLATISRLLPGVKESEWVQKIVKPLRELCWRYPTWKPFTAKVYIERQNPRSIVYAWRVDITFDTREPGKLRGALNQVRLAFGTNGNTSIKPEEVRDTTIRFIDELPDEIIERPLAWTNPDTQRNVPKAVASSYFNITGQQFKPGAGVEFLLDAAGSKK